MRKKDNRIKRRDALKWIAASGAAAVLGRSPFVSSVFAAEQTVRIGAFTGLRGLSFESPTGPVSIDPESQHVTMPIMVARGSKDGLQIVKRLGPIDPAPGCST